jgi:hypothetical protein
MASDPNALSEFDQDFLDFEVDRLVGSARVRVDQQRIHITELSRHASEKRLAKPQLRIMRSALKQLIAYKTQR